MFSIIQTASLSRRGRYFHLWRNISTTLSKLYFPMRNSCLIYLYSTFNNRVEVQELQFISICHSPVKYKRRVSKDNEGSFVVRKQ